MNVIVNDTTQPWELAVAVASMAVMSVLLADLGEAAGMDVRFIGGTAGCRFRDPVVEVPGWTRRRRPSST